MLTAAMMCMRKVEDGGWGKAAAIIDTHGTFPVDRLRYTARYWEVDRDYLDDNLLYSYASDIYELEKALREIVNLVQEKNIGIVIVDNLFEATNRTYKVTAENFSNYQPRQEHLIGINSIFHHLAHNFGCLVLYSNQVRKNWSRFGLMYEYLGDYEVEYFSNIKIHMDRGPKNMLRSCIPSKYRKDLNELRLKPMRASILDSDFIPMGTSFSLVGPMGLADPRNIESLAEQMKFFSQKEIMNIDCCSDLLDPLDDQLLSREYQIEMTRDLLYRQYEDEMDEDDHLDDEDFDEDDW